MAITQKLREIGGIINSTDLNYNFKRMQEDLALAVEGVIFSEKYSQVETLADRNAIPNDELVQGLWVAVAESGMVYEYNKKTDVKILPEVREFGINAGDLPEVPYRINNDATSGIAFDICYVCKAGGEKVNWQYVSEITGDTYNDGDWAVYQRIAEDKGTWIKVSKWIPIMNVASILESKLVGKLSDLHTENKERIVYAINEIHDDLGTVSELQTTTKSTAVAAINELDARAGELSNLKTSAKTNLVNAINEVDNNVGPIENLTTTNKGNVTLAINELDAEHGPLTDLHTEAKNTFVGAINEIHDDLGTVSSLTTAAKTNAVAAINEIDKDLGDISKLTTSTKVDAVSAINTIGNISNLTTTTKTSAVAAINELDTRAGEVSNLTTTAKTNLVSAINELDSDLGATSSLTTSSKTNVVGAINELDKEIGTLSSLTTAHKTTLVGAISEIDGDVGDISKLTTSAKADTVAAINELKSLTDTLRGATIVIGKINSATKDVTDALLTARAKEIMGTTTVQTGWTLVDNEQHEWHWNGANWQDLEQPNIYPAQNDTLGTVRGSSSGDVSITDGNMTVNHAANSTKLNGQAASYYARSAHLGTVNNLTTTAKVAVTAINELDAEIGNISSLKTENKTTLMDAINEVHDDLGTVSGLATTAKTNAVSAINELKSRMDTADTNITNLTNNKADKSNVLELNNTKPFDPTSEYHPATKKYVDELIGGASWGAITNNIEDQEDLMTLLDSYSKEVDVLTKTNTIAYTPTANYHPATKQYVDTKTQELNTWGKMKGDIADQQDLQNELIAKQDKATAWNTSNLVVSTTQPSVPATGYIVWIDLNN